LLPEQIVNVETNLQIVDTNTGEVASIEEFVNNISQNRSVATLATKKAEYGYFYTKEITRVIDAGKKSVKIEHGSTVTKTGGNIPPQYFTISASLLTSNTINGSFDTTSFNTKYNVKKGTFVSTIKSISSSKFWIGRTRVTAHYKGGHTSKKEIKSDKFLLNKKGFNYPYYFDSRMKKATPKPSSTLWKKIDKSDRVSWTTSKRVTYLDWYEDKYGHIFRTFYEVHHIKPREYGGNNEYKNLMPINADFHRKLVSPWWTNY